MADRRKQKTAKGIEQYKAFYPPLSDGERQILADRTCEGNLKYLHLTESGRTYFGEAIGIPCRICGEESSTIIYGRPYCYPHHLRAEFGKIGKVYGGYSTEKRATT